MPGNDFETPNNHEATQSQIETDAVEINGIALKGANKCLSFDEAIEKYTGNPSRPYGM